MLWLRFLNCHIAPIPKTLHWFQIKNGYIEQRLHSVTYKALTTVQPCYLSAQHDLCSPPPLVVLGPHLLSPYLDQWRITSSSSLKITNRSFRYVSPHLWNQLPVSFRRPCISYSTDDVTLSSSSCKCLATFTIHHTFIIPFQAKNHRFRKCFPP